MTLTAHCTQRHFQSGFHRRSLALLCPPRSAPLPARLPISANSARSTSAFSRSRSPSSKPQGLGIDAQRKGRRRVAHLRHHLRGGLPQRVEHRGERAPQGPKLEPGRERRVIVCSQMLVGPLDRRRKHAAPNVARPPGDGPSRFRTRSASAAVSSVRAFSAASSSRSAGRSRTSRSPASVLAFPTRIRPAARCTSPQRRSSASPVRRPAKVYVASSEPSLGETSTTTVGPCLSVQLGRRV